MDALEQLEKHQRLLGAIRIDFEEIGFPVFVKPQTFRESVEIGRARRDGKKDEALIYANLIAKKTLLEDGEPAFPNKDSEGKLRNVERLLVDKVPRHVVDGLLSAIIGGDPDEVAEQVEDIEKKPDTPGEVS